MTIEELFGTLQQSIVSTWRKHLRTAKYSKHIALNEFYEEMPEKVDALIEAWMGVNGKKIKSYDNVLQSKNMNTLTYLKELRKVVKQGYALMNGEAELEAKLDDIVELIDSTLYKVKELSESKVDLKDFLMESLAITINESINFLNGIDNFPSNWDLVDIFDETDMGKPAKLKNVAWDDYFEPDFIEANFDNIVKFFADFFSACDSIRTVDCGNIDEGGFNDEMFRKEVNIDSDEQGIALFKDGDDGVWTIITLVKPIKKLPPMWKKAVETAIEIYKNSGWYCIEYFDKL